MTQFTGRSIPTEVAGATRLTTVGPSVVGEVGAMTPELVETTRAA
jgi:hypothetical protein